MTGDCSDFYTVMALTGVAFGFGFWGAFFFLRFVTRQGGHDRREILEGRE